MEISPKAISANFLAEPRRQSGIALVFYILKFLRVAFKSLWPLVLVYFVRSSGSDGSDSFVNTYLLPVILAVAGFQLIKSVIAYFRFFYYTERGELIIEKGVFQKTRLNIPFERIQTINFNQNILHQILRVYEVKIDTAGSAGTELSIEALDKETAEAIRNYVLKERAGIIQEKAALEEGEEGAAVETKIEKDKLLFQRSERELLKIGISENHVQTFFIILGFLFGILNFGDDLFDFDYWEIYDETLEMLGGIFTTVVISLSIVLLILTIIVSLVRTVIRFHRLSVYESQSGFKIVAGLFNRKEQAAPFQKIQFMQWTVNPLQKRMDFRTIRLYQASSLAVAKAKALPIPGSSLSNLEAILTHIFPEHDRQGYQIEHISPKIIGRRVLYFGGIPALLLLLQAIFSGSIGLYVLAALWIPFIWLMARRYYERYEIYMNEKLMEIHSGLFGRKYTLLRLFKVQAVELVQSPYQRRKELANMELHTAAGVVKIPYLPLSQAQEIRDYILYEVEREDREWM
ncbi:MAG: PH domain-containing protein [Bacteroidota bacterium]